jgi:hypothetical protein
MTVETAKTWRVRVGGGADTSAVFDPALAAPTGTLFICAHGAGGHMDDAAMLAVTGELRRRGVHVVRFNFLYRDKQSHRPDPMPRLKDCFAAVVAHARDTVAADLDVRRLIIGGRSMGGRAASMLAADGYRCDGLLLLAYPLHPAGQTDKLRDAHLARIRIPVLCFNGTRDALCQRDLMARAVGRLSNWTMHWLQGADHGFHVLKSSGRTDNEVLAEVGQVYAQWEEGLGTQDRA